MKKILAILVLVLFGTMSYAQWLPNGAGIVYFNAGNVGIGTSTPAAILHMVTNSATNFRAESSYSGTGTTVNLASVQLRSTTYNQGFAMAFRRHAGGFQDILQTCNLSVTPNVSVEFMYFRYDTQKWQMKAGVAEAEFQNSGNLLFNNTGAVGVNVTAPADFKAGVKFQVNGGAYVAGRVRCHEVEVALAPTFVWPDYVFGSNYKLTSLYDVESFINTNKHLPGVPSQAEIASDGVKLGEMNATLLQKVEELTLYMINLQKENDALKVRVNNLEK
jgi:hypothetical protein